MSHFGPKMAILGLLAVFKKIKRLGGLKTPKKAQKGQKEPGVSPSKNDPILDQTPK